MRKYIFYFTILFCFTNCKKNTVNTELLLGDWEFITPATVIDTDSDVSTSYYRSDFRFENDSIFKLNDGFFQRTEDNNSISKPKYVGQKSKYYVKHDSLYILDIINGKYFAQKINKLSRDTLALYDKDAGTNFFYHKRKTEKPTQIHLSQIVVSLGPCFGRCPISSISIDSEGNLIYYGKANTSYDGLFKGKVDKKFFRELVVEFNIIRFEELNNNYSVGNVTDLPSLSVSFIKDSKIFKTIYDYGYAGPRSLHGILNTIIYSYQNANLQQLDYDFPIVNPGFPPNFLLDDSETFYLQTLLLKAPKTEAKFISKFNQRPTLILPENFDYEKYDQMKRKIETDGRYFRIEDKNHGFSTFDLDFNFFKENEAFIKE